MRYSCDDGEVRWMLRGSRIVPFVRVLFDPRECDVESLYTNSAFSKGAIRIDTRHVYITNCAFSKGAIRDIHSTPQWRTYRSRGGDRSRGIGSKGGGWVVGGIGSRRGVQKAERRGREGEERSNSGEKGERMREAKKMRRVGATAEWM
ncbi:hypothetical protein Sjap_010698 [Stephania japonica]|uniref:Uncharacterized protein n=1 Tax=Stephania japonica TaxID=461633 RepID=A0AAP0P7D6_9MAGN